MNKKAMFLNFLDQVKDTNPALVESLREGFLVIHENEDFQFVERELTPEEKLVDTVVSNYEKYAEVCPQPEAYLLDEWNYFAKNDIGQKELVAKWWIEQGFISENGDCVFFEAVANSPLMGLLEAEFGQEILEEGVMDFMRNNQEMIKKIVMAAISAGLILAPNAEAGTKDKMNNMLKMADKVLQVSENPNVEDGSDMKNVLSKMGIKVSEKTADQILAAQQKGSADVGDVSVENWNVEDAKVKVAELMGSQDEASKIAKVLVDIGDKEIIKQVFDWIQEENSDLAKSVIQSVMKMENPNYGKDGKVAFGEPEVK